MFGEGGMGSVHPQLPPCLPSYCHVHCRWAAIHHKVQVSIYSVRAKKKGKLGIKFWVLADAEKPYVLNVNPYLGKQYDDQDQHQLGEFVVTELMKPFLVKGYNVTLPELTCQKYYPC